MVWILAPAVLIVIVSFFLTFRSAASFRQGVLLNVTLPREATTHEQVQELVGAYKKYNFLFFLVGLALGLLLLLPLPPSLTILGLFGWLGLMGLLGSLNLAKYSNRLASLKQAEGWFVGETDVISVDLIVARERKRMPVSRLWFLPLVVLTLVLFIWGFTSAGSFFPALHGASGLAVYFLAWHLSVRERARVFSEDTKVNLALTKISVRSWTLTWVGLANLHVVVLLILLLLRHTEPTIPISLFLQTFAFLAAIALTANTIKRKQDEILAAAGPTITVDQDRYWRGGFYNNPHDPRVMVEKRVGYGATLNFGTRRGKIVGYGVLGGVTALLIVLLFVFIAFDTAQYALQITEKNITVEAPIYGFSFPTKELRSVAALDSLPSGMRTNGAETLQYSLGNYTMPGYGKSKLYIYKDKPPYLVLELADLYVFFNAKTRAETEKYYEYLRALLAN